MKFVMIVLVIRFVAELISSKRKKVAISEGNERNEKILHPAEFELRQH